VSAAGTTGTVSLTVERQKMSEWCWAAVSVSVDRLFRPSSTHTQCEIAGATLKAQCCAGNLPAPSAQCNAPHELHPVLGTLHLLAAEPIVKPVAFADVQKQIDAGHPICVLIKWLDKDGKPGDRGHFIAISGYRVTPSQKQFVSIADPFFGDSEIDYTQFASPQGGYRDGRGVWFASFLVNNEAAGH
jgi:hypothetical protein